MSTPKKRVKFSKSYGKYMPGDDPTLPAAEADNMVRRGFARLAPLKPSGVDEGAASAGAGDGPDASQPAIGSYLEALRSDAKDAGIKGYHRMKVETLEARLLEASAASDQEE
jgi:hypothetical protein